MNPEQDTEAMVRSLMGRVLELENKLGAHIPDASASGYNYPHPHLQVASLTAGDAEVRIDSDGVSIVAVSSIGADEPLRKVKWVTELGPNGELVADIYGVYYTGIGSNYLMLEVEQGASHSGVQMRLLDSGGTAVTSLAITDGVGAGIKLDYYVQSNRVFSHLDTFSMTDGTLSYLIVGNGITDYTTNPAVALGLDVKDTLPTPDIPAIASMLAYTTDAGTSFTPYFWNGSEWLSMLGGSGGGSFMWPLTRFTSAMLAERADVTIASNDTYDTEDERLIICKDFTVANGVTLTARQGLFIICDRLIFEDTDSIISADGAAGGNASGTTAGAAGANGAGSLGSDGGIGGAGRSSDGVGNAGATPSAITSATVPDITAYTISEDTLFQNLFGYVTVASQDHSNNGLGGRGGGGGGGGGASSTHAGGAGGSGGAATGFKNAVGGVNGAGGAISTVGGSGLAAVQQTLPNTDVLKTLFLHYFLWKHGMGTGGGGGGGGGRVTSGNSGAGGGGGGGGGVIIIIAREVVGSGVVRANGGNGGNGSASTTGNAGEGGAGAGGGGGTVMLFASSYTGTPTVQANGGTAGTPGAGSGGPNGGPAAAGGTGVAIMVLT